MKKIREVLARDTETRLGLLTTKMTFDLWCTTLESRVASPKLIAECELLIAAAARDDWGVDTECVINRATKEVLIKCKDGRSENMNYAMFKEKV